MRATGFNHVVAVAGALALAAGVVAQGQERPRTSTAVQAPAQGGGGLEPVHGAPPAIEPSLESQTVSASLARGLSPKQATALAPFRVVSTARGEATLEIEGACEVVGPGSRIGSDTVRSVTESRIVLERPAQPGRAGGAALVIVTLDEARRQTTRVFSTGNPDTQPEGARRP